MFYSPGQEPSDLPYNPFKACCVPRPIGWISTVDREGISNLAPYSQFQNVSWDPPMISVAVNCRPDGTPKDTAANAIATGAFGWSMATERHLLEVIRSNDPLAPGEDEFAYTGLAKKAAVHINAPLVDGAPAHFECRLAQSIFIPGRTPEAGTYLLIGEVIGIHIDEECLTQGMMDIAKIRPLARMGYLDFAVISETFCRTDLVRSADEIAFLKDTSR